MKIRIILFLITVIFGCQLYSQSTATTISFKEKVYDFGKILESKGKVSHTFTFLNKSKVPVNIESISSGCGCATYSYNKEPIRSGHKGKITITFDPLYHPGFFSKEITIFSNNHNKINRIWVKGYVVAFIHPIDEDYPYTLGNGLHTSLKVLAFGEMTNGMNKQIKLRYANNTDKPMTLKFVIEGSDKNIKFTDPGVLSPMKRGEMTISYTMGKTNQKEKMIKIYPVVNGKKLSQCIQTKITCI
ncbi:DUF1573 domain-containing protein [uncultured Bacteroides sp.]|uniref:DUF1573 domain-containing protein n=1 Tax=uncultured Bacteroides sp. TaxID=162156 RepID=UPI002AAC070B|nr:DUF1573 domain-containing protein [uncultured Bacteroides sp.]